jgi:hypothetical protein
MSRATESAMELRCPNCGQTHRGVSACALGVVLGVIEDRGELALETITPEIVAEIDVNEFWDRVGPVTVWVEEQLLALGAQEVAP